MRLLFIVIDALCGGDRLHAAGNDGHAQELPPIAASTRVVPFVLFGAAEDFAVPVVVVASIAFGAR